VTTGYHSDVDDEEMEFGLCMIAIANPRAFCVNAYLVTHCLPCLTLVECILSISRPVHRSYTFILVIAFRCKQWLYMQIAMVNDGSQLPSRSSKLSPDRRQRRGEAFEKVWPCCHRYLDTTHACNLVHLKHLNGPVVHKHSWWCRF
jgi:hypothetical protein